jgi:WD40 repeat protein
MLATASTLGVLKLWDVSPSRPMLTLPGHAGGALATAFAGDSGVLASRDLRGAVRLWDLSTGRCTRTIAGSDALSPDTAPAGDWDNADLADQQESLACSPDGKRIAAIDAAGTAIVLYSTVSGESFVIPPSGGAVSLSSLAFSPDGKTLAAGCADNKIRLWDAVSLQLARTVAVSGAVGNVRFSPDGRLLAASCDGTIHVFEAVSGQPLATQDGHLERIRSLVFSPDGRTLASAGGDGVRLWDVSSRKSLGALEGEAGPVYCLAFSPDGGTLACSDHNRTIRLWQLPSGRCIASLQTGERFAWSLAFSSDGRMLACGGSGDSLRLFNLAYYDRNILGNYPFYLELAHRSPERLEKISLAGVARWATAWDAEPELPLWAAAVLQPAVETGVDPARVADWGQLTRHRLLTALRTLGHKPIQARLSVAGATDPPIASVIFSPAPGDTRVHTLLGSGSSPDRARSTEYQRQRLNGIRPAATQPASPGPTTPPA